MSIEISGTILISLILLIVQGVLGAFDTLWFHEFKAKLPSNTLAWKELQLHALRSFIYGIIFATIAWFRVEGIFTVILIMLLVSEIIITLMDFIEEDNFRKLDHGERVGHAIMGIIYGGFLAFFIPELIDWIKTPTGLSGANYGIISYMLSLMAFGVTLSAIRDIIASISLHKKFKTSELVII